MEEELKKLFKHLGRAFGQTQCVMTDCLDGPLAYGLAQKILGRVGMFNDGFMKFYSDQAVKMSSKSAETIYEFKANDIDGKMEPGTNAEIKEFAAKYGVEFDMFEKIKVNGDDAHELWKYLKKKQGGLLGSFIKWNFTKFVINKNGIPVSRHGPNVDPLVSFSPVRYDKLLGMEDDLKKWLEK
ncbi:unnamed protein product [Darwinula stevensoni]|uniref:Glutathione peroxidase n=1 Tax=Darwinula stevensoni TaxID=69355 RepID=A0A7R9FQC0_9CRUS|nr:unnamed protein product [Darwinula stevensoni]CAG0899148.1 unnamed protein product [Darwinula stevensoni]